MVQIIQERRKPSFADKLGLGIDRGLETGMNLYQDYQNKEKLDQQMKQENEAAKRMGIDLSGITDPKIRQKAFEFAMQSANQQQLEGMKQSGKQNLLNNKQDFLGKILGNQNQQEGNENPNQMNQQNGGQQFNPMDISDADIAQATALDPNLGRVLQQQKDIALRERRAEKESQRSERRYQQDFAYKRAGKVLEEADKARTTLPIREAAVNAMEDAISSNDLSFWSLDSLADKTGIEAFRSAAGGQFKSASKNFLVSNVSKFGSRPNMYIEQQVADMLPKIGRSKEANLTALEMLKFEKDIDAQRVKIIDDLEDHYMKTEEHIPGNISKEVDKQMKTFVDARQKQFMMRLKQLQQQEKFSDKTRVEPGTMLSDDKAEEYLNKANGDRKRAEEMAKMDGYEF